MKKLVIFLCTTTLFLSGCASLVENDIFSPSKPNPSEAYEDPNKTDELRDCIRDKKRKPQEPECFLKNR